MIASVTQASVNTIATMDEPSIQMILSGMEKDVVQTTPAALFQMFVATTVHHDS